MLIQLMLLPIFFIFYMVFMCYGWGLSVVSWPALIVGFLGMSLAKMVNSIVED